MSIPSADTPPLIMGKRVKGGLPTNGQVLSYNSTGDYWEAITLPAGTPHDLLDGSVDQDTVAHAVAAGDLIFGNATPKWDGLAKGAAGAMLTISGANLPAWLAPGTNGYLLVMVAGVPAWVSFGASAGYLKGGNPPTLQTGIPLADLLNAGGAAGDVIYWDGANFVRLAIGATGKVLKVAAGLPSWGDTGTVQESIKSGGDQLINGAAFVDITSLSLTMPASGFALITCVLNFENTQASGATQFQFVDNGVAQEIVQVTEGAAGGNQVVTITYITTCAGQTVKVQGKDVSGDTTIYGNATTKSWINAIQIG